MNLAYRIMTLEALRSRRITHMMTDGNREFVTLMACICADGTSIPVSLIYKGESHDLQDSWVDQIEETDEVFFAASANGWTCKSLGLQWLQKVFDPATKAKAGRSKRLLIVDGHSSHVNMEFINWADQNGIIIHILPSHTTHRLQPLDVGLFSPLSTAYSKQLSNLMHKSLGMVSMTKRFFYPLFRDAYRASFTKKNILHAFEKPGIFPVDPEKVLGKLKRIEVPKGPDLPVDQLQTPKSCRAVRRVQKAYKQTHSEALLDLVFKANVALAAQVSIDQHIINGLHAALKMERQKRKKGKKLNLVGEDDIGPQFYSPDRVRRALAFQDEKEANEQADRDRITNKKAQSAANKVQKEADKAARALQTAARRQHAQEEKDRKVAERAQKAIERQAKKEAKLAEAQAKKAAKLAKSAIPKPKAATQVRRAQNVVANDHAAGKGKKVVASRTTRGRAVIMPRLSL